MLGYVCCVRVRLYGVGVRLGPRLRVFCVRVI